MVVITVRVKVCVKPGCEWSCGDVIIVRDEVL